MIDNKGVGKFELLTVLVLIMVVTCILLYNILGIGKDEGKKFSNMKDRTIRFGSTVTTNLASFRDDHLVYLEEVINEQFFTEIKSPFSSNNCDPTFSRVDILKGSPYVTLKCDDYLVDSARINSQDMIKIYKVSDWHEERKDDKEEEKALYNCVDTATGKNIYDEYFESGYLLYKLNRDFESDYYTLDSVPFCNVVSKPFYRTKEEVILDN